MMIDNRNRTRMNQRGPY